MFKQIWKKIKPISSRKLLDKIENLENHIHMMRLENNIDKIFSIENFLSNSQNLSKEQYYERDFNEVKFYLPFVGKDAIQTIIFKELNFFSVKELQKIDVILKQYILQDGKAIAFDIGANIGNHSIYWAINKRFSQIYSFEPIDYTYKILLKNIELNSLEKNIKAYNMGIGEKKSRAILKQEYANNIGANQLEVMREGNILIDSLDNFMQDENLTRVDFVKIDVEGFEDKVFLGAKNFFEKFRPLIMVEIFDEYRQNIFEILNSYNYSLLTNISKHDYIFLYKDK